MSNTFPWFNFLTSLVAVIALLVSAWGLYYSWEANSISRKALEETSEIFVKENRPYLNVQLVKFEGTDKYLRFIPKERSFNIAVQFKVSNDGKTPANDISVPVSAFIGKNQFKMGDTLKFILPPQITIDPGEAKVYVWDTEIGYGDFNADETKRMLESNELSVEVSMQWLYKSSLDDEKIYKTIAGYLVKNDELVLIKSKME